jgi:2'-5' RNA ligase
VTEPITYTGAPFTTEPGAIVFLPPDAERGFTEDEAYAFLSGGMDAVEALIAASGQAHTGAMIAFIPGREDLTELVIDDEAAEPLEELHITAAYLGDADDVDVETREEIITQLTDLAMNQPVIVADIIGFAVLNPDGPEPCLVANVSGPDVADAHDSILELLDDMGVTLPFQHKPWLAHLTLGYADDPRRWLTDELMDKTGLITIDRIRVAFAGVVTDIPFGTPPLTAAQVFHLPGKHDQHTHGRGGASSGEVAAARRLNAGKNLDHSDPDQARVGAAIEAWSGTHGGNETGRIKYEMQQARSDPDADTDGAALMRTVGASEAGSPELYRGMPEVHPNDVPQVGDVISLGPTSFTRSRKVADDFALPDDAEFGRPTQVRVKLAKGSHSLRIDQEVTGKFRKEQEHLGMGKYRVTGRREKSVTVKARSGGKKTITSYEVDLEQVGDDVPVTRSSRENIIEGPGMGGL